MGKRNYHKSLDVIFISNVSTGIRRKDSSKFALLYSITIFISILLL